MKYAILGDIHANLEALNVVLEDCAKRKVTHFCCLGDVVGYNPNPKQCLDIVRDMNMPCVKGNHDEYCSTDIDLIGFNPQAAIAVKWTRDQLSLEDRKWLAELKYVRHVESFTIVHATLDTPQRWGYVFKTLEASPSMSYQNTAICFFGHTHHPLAFIRENTIKGGTYSKIKIEIGRKYFINAGSVGQPRDGNPQAAYATYDMFANIVELHRLDYDIATTQKKIRAAGLPERLASRLELGK
ncbi:MAG: metallophosphoesterase [Verrucomicrobiae bacterium]|nr:metallophosphoesterase [Verrucomicrobiae bacterium]